MVSSMVYPSLERKPGGPDNWVERAGGLPRFIEGIAKHIHYENGKSISHSIAAAVNTVKRWARGGTVTKYGVTKHVTPATVAKAIKAVAEWEAKKKAGSLNLTDAELAVIDLTDDGADHFAFDLLDLADADVDDHDTMVALMLPAEIATKLVVEGGVPVEDMHITLAFFKDLDDKGFDDLVAEVKEYCVGVDAPIEGTVGGLDHFEAKDPDKGTPYFAQVQIADLKAFQAGLAEWIDYDSDYPEYKPHVTLTYVKEGEDPPEPPPSTPVAFNAVWVVRGNKQRVEVPFGDGAGVDLTSHAILSAGDIDLSKGIMELQALAERANRLADPAERAQARAKILNLAFGSDVVDGTVIDLASTIAPRNAKGKASDGRNSFAGQGKFKHGFIPVNQAAKEAKSKGSPIAMKRMKRLFGADKAPDDPRTSTREVPKSPSPIPSKVAAAKYDKSATKPEPVKAATGRAGNRVAAKKRNPSVVNIDEKDQPGAENAKDLASLRNTDFGNEKTPDANITADKLEASKSSRVPKRATQNWDQIPEALKTVRNGKRYIVAEFDGKQFVTEWIGGVRRSESAPLQDRKVMSSITSADAAALSQSALRALIANPKSSPDVKAAANKALRVKGAVK